MMILSAIILGLFLSPNGANAADPPVLHLAPGPSNPRNSEGDFIRLTNGQWVFVYTRFTAGTSDHDAADLVSRMSDDDGKTWSRDDQVVLANEGQWNVMSVSLLRLADGRIAMFYLRKQSLSDCRPLVRFSSDEMQSWSESVEIIPDPNVGYYVLNNDRAVQLANGRILVPLALHTPPKSNRNENENASMDWVGRITSFHSDDNGQTWHASETIQEAYSNDDPATRITAQEPGVIELRDGRLMMWIRTGAGQQYQCWSKNGGQSWSRFVPMNLASPLSPATIERIPRTGDLIAVWNDHSRLPIAARKRRTPLSYAISQDEGVTWTQSQNIADDPNGWYCYTAIDFTDDCVLLGHVAGTQGGNRELATTVVNRLPLETIYRQSKLPYLVDVNRIWDDAKHNAFTDLVRFQDQWFCAFREGSAHVSADGALRVLTSRDGRQWTSAALITSDVADLRDAKLTVTPTDQLMLSGAGAMHDTSEFKHQSMSWFSEDGATWSDAHAVGDRDNWLWRTTWHDDSLYGVGYQTNHPSNRFVKLYQSNDGRSFSTLVDRLFDRGYPNESSLLFTDDDTCYCLLRCDAAEKTGQLGQSSPPYTQWKWRDLGVQIGGPQMIQLPDDRVVAAVRLYDKPVRTSLCWLDLSTGTLEEFLTLPSGGDTSYAGMVWHDNHLWVSYYSAHEANPEFTTAIYVAQVAIPEH